MLKRKISYLKDEIDAVSSKLNELEKVYDNKIGFMESNMTRIFEKEEELKKKEELSSFVAICSFISLNFFS